MTELSYSMSDIQTRIFEIQELRHQSQSSEDASSSSTTVIDQALMSLDERLEGVNRGMKSVNDAMQPFLLQAPTPKPDAEDGDEDEADEASALLRKHTALVAEWESVQDETEVLREELKEDKWLTVFRTVSEQADGMMSSLEKAVQRCQDFIWRAHRRAAAAEESPRSSFSGSPSNSERKKAPLTYETFLSLQDSFEAKKKHYMPATSKVLSIIDKGVQDRVTKNGECLRRHAESTARWKNLRERITRTDVEMEKVRRLFLSDCNDETESVMSDRTSKSSIPMNSSTGHGLATPPSEGSRGRSNAMGTLSRSMSPLRKFAKKLTKVGRGTPTQSPSPAPNSKTPATVPTLKTLKKRQSLFPMKNPISAMTAVTPERFTHKHSHSFTPESPSMSRKQSETNSSVAGSTVKLKGPKWNSSTKVEDEGIRTVKVTKKPSLNSMRVLPPLGDIPPVPPLPGHNRPSSRSSFASSRPWSPITASQGSTTRSSISRPPSRASPSASGSRANGRGRPSAGTIVPTPPYWRSVSGSSEMSFEDSSAQSSLMQRLSPTPSTMTDGTSYPPRSKTPMGTPIPHPRPPSRSMIPIPKLAFSSASRPSTAMSDYDDNPPRPGSSMSFRSSANRAQTPEYALRSRVSQLPYYSTPNDPSPSSPSHVQSPSATLRRASSRLPPSSFRDSAPHLPQTPSHSQPRSVSSGSRPASRSSSRAGEAYIPGYDNAQMQRKYIPHNPNDPLDAEIAAVVNAFPHGLLVERVDPPMPARAPPPAENEEVKAQYAFTNQLARKVVTCRLLTMGRATAKSRKKVMCRVGGGWQELQLYILNRQAGM
ncbi:hypothetical protein SCHPADRAFT_820635 [Schizopora paradoxa]|uniref:GAR domain-containing protein n=1 Tax=Schizopora paradoxa TaxID=27342 RepID=A0A0H2S8K3_9AGAM|nr:hypothetical protein SCHPADRAFT_820635 [Schizopora paradoxa]